MISSKSYQMKKGGGPKMKYLVLTGVVALLAGIIIWSVRHAAGGESGCGCNCETGCSDRCCEKRKI
jgi:hypothetical protein